MMVFACCSTAFSQNDDKANVLALEKSTADAFTKHNLPYLNTAFADDASIITQQGVLVNKQQLMQYVPDAIVHKFHHWLVLHGRYICVARNPKCYECGLRPVCKYFKKEVEPKVDLPKAKK